ncbi:MAG: 4-hydroxybutyrate dehydrogenase [Synergistes sp.]|nr:4-hydroxybutyrate dehydrogenase [Synergistes sp.]
MKQISLAPEIHKFSTCAEFVKEFCLGENDLLFTAKPIYETYFKPQKLPVAALFIEDFGFGEPTDIMVDGIINAMRDIKYKRIIAVGGGSVIDIAKALAVSQGRFLDTLYENVPSLSRACEFIIIPTTCGTGSEVTNISIINRTKLGTKMGLVSPALFADKAVLIPELLEKLPFEVFATSSIDALVHAVESALSPKASEFTKLYSYNAIMTIIKNYQKIMRDGRCVLKSLLDSFLTASTFAGIAFGNAGCAAVHALSYPLGGKYHVPHGESNYAIFTGVMKNYMEIRSDGEMDIMIKYIAALLNCGNENVWNELENLLNGILPKKPLRAYGTTEEDIAAFTKAVMETQTRLMSNNFVPLDEGRVLKIYRELY